MLIGVFIQVIISLFLLSVGINLIFLYKKQKDKIDKNNEAKNEKDDPLYLYVLLILSIVSFIIFGALLLNNILNVLEFADIKFLSPIKTESVLTIAFSIASLTTTIIITLLQQRINKKVKESNKVKEYEMNKARKDELIKNNISTLYNDKLSIVFFNSNLDKIKQKENEIMNVIDAFNVDDTMFNVDDTINEKTIPQKEKLSLYKYFFKIDFGENIYRNSINIQEVNKYSLQINKKDSQDSQELTIEVFNCSKSIYIFINEPEEKEFNRFILQTTKRKIIADKTGIFKFEIVVIDNRHIDPTDIGKHLRFTINMNITFSISEYNSEGIAKGKVISKTITRKSD